MKITLNQNPLFSWESDQDTIDRILEDFPRAAEVGGRTPEAFAGDILKRLPDVLRSDDDVMQEIATMGVLWWILQFETSNAEHPGKVADYAAGTDFKAHLTLTRSGGTIKLTTIIQERFGKLDS
jgi:hypothetical protein